MGNLTYVAGLIVIALVVSAIWQLFGKQAQHSSTSPDQEDSSGWRPMASVPLDGTIVMLQDNYNDKVQSTGLYRWGKWEGGNKETYGWLSASNPEIALTLDNKFPKWLKWKPWPSAVKLEAMGIIAVTGHHLNRPEPSPTPIVDSPTSLAIWDLCIADFQSRDQFGLGKYGTRLHAADGRDTLIDAYQEACDLVVYLRKAIYERDGK